MRLLPDAFGHGVQGAAAARVRIVREPRAQSPEPDSGVLTSRVPCDTGCADVSIPTSTSLSVRSLLKAAIDRLGSASTAGAVNGLTESARALFVAGTARRDTVSLLVVPIDAEVDAMTGDVSFFFASLEGLPDTDARRAVWAFPSLEIDPYRGLAPHFEVASARAGTLCALLRGEARIVVASASALLPRVSAPDHMREASTVLAPGDETSPTALGDLLSRAGFVREDPVDAHGEFCVRGGVVDFFPAGDDHPVRLEFVDETVESVRRYDAATQRSVGTIERVAVTPVHERFDTDDVDDAPPLVSCFEYLAAHDLRILTSEPHEVAAQLTASHERLLEAFESARARDESPTPPDRLALGPDDVQARLGAAVRLTSLDLDEQTDSRPHAVRVPCQPAIEFRGRIADWLAAVRRAPAADQTVLFIASTSGNRAAHRRAAHRRRCAGGPWPKPSSCRRAPRHSSRSDSCPAGSNCPTPGYRSTPKPTSSTSRGGPARAVGRWRTPSSPIFATSRSVTTSSTSIMGSACSWGFASSKSARMPKSSWSCATRRARSCSCRSSTSTSSRSTPAQVGRRSNGSAV